MIKDVHIKIKTTREVDEKIKELIRYYQETTSFRVTKTTIIEEAVNELYKKIKTVKG